MERSAVLAKRDQNYERLLIVATCQTLDLPHVADALLARHDRRAQVTVENGLTSWQDSIVDAFITASCELQRRMREESDDDDRIAYLQDALRHSALTFAALRKAVQE